MNHSISCTYIGHATNIIRFGESSIITDPHFRNRIFTQRRLITLPVEPWRLPDFDLVLLSHVHCGHFDVSSYKYISCKTPIIVPDGTERAVGQFIPNPVIELSHFSSHKLHNGITVTALPVRAPFFKFFPIRYRGASAYLIRSTDGDRAVYFCGDSAYGDHFKEASDICKIDAALLPIGAYEPKWMMKNLHMTPEEAVAASEDLRTGDMIPICHGTFRLSMEKPEAPKERLSSIVASNPDLQNRVHILAPGESFDLKSKKL